jgi:hypothetical protein
VARFEHNQHQELGHSYAAFEWLFSGAVEQYDIDFFFLFEEEY